MPQLADDAVSEDHVRSLPESEKGMSNFDHSIDEGLEDDLRAGMRAQHSAWDFCGTVIYDPDRGSFVEIVRRYHVVAAIFAAKTLRDLMHEVNDSWGWG